MISTSGRFRGEGGRAAGEQQVPHDKAVRNDKALKGELGRALEHAQQYGLPFG
jgi:hypothetical protein